MGKPKPELLHPKYQMPMLSFSWTLPAVLHRRKTCTRRKFSTYYLTTFKSGREFCITDKRLEYGGQVMGIGQMLRDAYPEPLSRIPDSDYEAEGFDFFEEHPELLTGQFKGMDIRNWCEVMARELRHDPQLRNVNDIVLRFQPIDIFHVPELSAPQLTLFGG